jgi:hypothetical protein
MSILKRPSEICRYFIAAYLQSGTTSYVHVHRSKYYFTNMSLLTHRCTNMSILTRRCTNMSILTSSIDTIRSPTSAGVTSPDSFPCSTCCKLIAFFPACVCVFKPFSNYACLLSTLLGTNSSFIFSSCVCVFKPFSYWSFDFSLRTAVLDYIWFLCVCKYINVYVCMYIC